MKRGVLILVIGLLAAVIGYCFVYRASTVHARSWQERDQPELAWLQHEFNLSDSEFKLVSDLHASYLPHCREMCEKIDAQNVHIRNLLTVATNATPEIAAALTESAQLRAECQRMMLNHFFKVGHSMPTEQGRRYLSWVTEKAFTPEYGMIEMR